MPQPLLSVCLITYNHAKFIRQAIDGILFQKVNFSWEIIIADDCSTDENRKIILEYEKKNPGLVKLLFQEKNVGPKKNFLDLITAAKGKYIAYFEGDDYWTDPNKIQKQVDFLEANPDYAICFHHIYLQQNFKKPKLSTFYKTYKEQTFTIEDLAKGNFINTPSVVFRHYPEIFAMDAFNQSPVGDYLLHIFNARFGKIKYFPEPMAVYRIHHSNTWVTQSSLQQNEKLLKVVQVLIPYFEKWPKVLQNLNYQYAHLKSEIAEICINKDDTEGYLQNLKEAFLKSEEYMDEWLISSNARYKKIAQSKEYKIGWALKNPKYIFKKFTSLKKSKNS